METAGRKPFQLVIFDLDSTLTRPKSGDTFRRTEDDWEWMPGRREVLATMHKQHVLVGIATNQGGVAFGHLHQGKMLHELMKVQKEADAKGMSVCFAHPKAPDPEWRKGAERRKPSGAMLHEVMAQCGVFPPHVLYVGDLPEDAEAAKNAGVPFTHADDFFREFATVQDVQQHSTVRFTDGRDN